jgi:hypothetical protein
MFVGARYVANQYGVAVPGSFSGLLQQQGKVGGERRLCTVAYQQRPRILIDNLDCILR